MQACTRRVFMNRVVLGTATLAAVGRALADPSGSAARPDGCARCRYYSSASATTGTCAFAGKTVSADGGCGEFTRGVAPPTAAAANLASQSAAK
jgi:hypothetical protein